MNFKLLFFYNNKIMPISFKTFKILSPYFQDLTQHFHEESRNLIATAVVQRCFVKKLF